MCYMVDNSYFIMLKKPNICLKFNQFLLVNSSVILKSCFQKETRNYHYSAYLLKKKKTMALLIEFSVLKLQNGSNFNSYSRQNTTKCYQNTKPGFY